MNRTTHSKLKVSRYTNRIFWLVTLTFCLNILAPSIFAFAECYSQDALELKEEKQGNEETEWEKDLWFLSSETTSDLISTHWKSNHEQVYEWGHYPETPTPPPKV